MDINIFHTLVIVFSLAIVVNLLFKVIRMPIILGYLVIGMIAGPEGMGWLSDDPIVAMIAEFGLVFLLFRIGLEFSLQKIWQMRSSVFGFGGMQVSFSILGGMVVGYYFKVTPTHSFIIGSIIAMSSTAVVSKMLAENKELSSQYGKDMIALLLMQDLVVVPILFILPMLPQVQHASSLGSVITVATVKAGALFALMYILGRFLFKPVYYFTAKTHSDELFTLLTLFIVVLAAWLSEQFNMSLTLGSFLAGMLLGETEYRHKIITEIRPFQDIFLGMFFVTVGMQFSLSVMHQYFSWFLLMMMGLIVAKFVLIFTLGILLKRDKLNSLITSVRLAHGGEFGFAILAVCQRHHLMPDDYVQVILEVILASLIVGTLLNFSLVDLLNRFLKKQKQLVGKRESDISVVVCGYGQVGSELGGVLQRNDVSFYAIDANLACVEDAIKKGHPVYFADASLNEIRYVIKEASPKVIIICFREEDRVYRAVTEILHSGYQGKIIARTSNVDQAEYLRSLGVEVTVPEISSTVYAILEKLLVQLDCEEEMIHAILDDYISQGMVS